MQPDFRETLVQFVAKQPFSHRLQLIEIFAGESGTTSSGYPFISDESFDIFKSIPHLFGDGLALYRWIDDFERRLADSTSFTEEELGHLQRICQVLRTIIYTASVTAPPDLWILRHALSCHRQAGILDSLFQKSFCVAEYAYERSLSARQLQLDMSLLYCRGYLDKKGSEYSISAIPQARDVFANITAIEEPETDWVDVFMQLLRDPHSYELRQRIENFLQFSAVTSTKEGWQAGIFEIETGYRLVPIVLGLRALEWTTSLRTGVDYSAVTPEIPLVVQFLQKAALLDGAGKVTALGERVFSRGPGPFGIIYTYHPYMKNLPRLLAEESVSAWVNRGENVAASRDANSKTFLMANRSLDQFCAKYGYQFDVFIEHAVGQGEATHQRFTRDGEDSIQYFGADLEQAAIDKAIVNQKSGLLPKNMIFIQADIGSPQTLIDEINKAQFSTNNAVMLVGNGFHEIRQQTNEKMIDVFRQYQQAGILLVFTEESALSDEDLITTAWNTYHAGFRYVHELSGQGLRPVYDTEENSERFSWKKCATLAGYKVLPRYTTRTRTIFPSPCKNGYNPSISINYFCIPQPLAERLGIEPVGN